MTSAQIIEQIAKDKLIESIIKTYSNFQYNYYLEDLTQDIYITLLNSDEDLIKRLYLNNELSNYIRKIIKNNLYSKTSPFYYNYERFRNNLDNEIDNG